MCIGRSPVDSDLATTEHVRKHTTIPVPEAYFNNSNPNNAVGAVVVLMERLPGVHLYNTWSSLTLDHKKAIIEKIAGVLAKLASLKFDWLGSLQTDGRIGDILLRDEESPAQGIFDSVETYTLSSMPDPSDCTKELNELNQPLRHELLKVLTKHKSHPTLSPPYRLIHVDFDAQDMLFTQPDPTQPLQLTGIIDWDWSRTSTNRGF